MCSLLRYRLISQLSSQHSSFLRMPIDPRWCALSILILPSLLIPIITPSRPRKLSSSPVPIWNQYNTFSCKSLSHHPTQSIQTAFRASLCSQVPSSLRSLSLLYRNHQYSTCHPLKTSQYPSRPFHRIAHATVLILAPSTSPMLSGFQHFPPFYLYTLLLVTTFTRPCSPIDITQPDVEGMFQLLCISIVY